MKTRKPLARRTPLKAKRELKRTSKLKGTKQLVSTVKLKRTTKLEKVNRARRKKLDEKQFGRKRQWVKSMPCCVTGKYSTPEWPIDPAHVGSPDPDVRGQSTRGAGADSTFIAPLHRVVHTHFDFLPDGKFLELYGIAKSVIREHAAQLHVEYTARFDAEQGLPTTED